MSQNIEQNIAAEITRLGQAKAAIIESIESKGVNVLEGTKYDGLSTYIDQICACGEECCSGGGGNEPVNPSSGSDKIEYIDVDGTVLASFDVGDTISADDVPTFPTHTGLTPVEDENQNPLWSKTLAEVNALDHPENIYPRYIVDGDKLVIKVEVPEDGADIELNEIYVPSTIAEPTQNDYINLRFAIPEDNTTVNIQIPGWLAGDRIIKVNWGDSNEDISHTFASNLYNPSITQEGEGGSESSIIIGTYSNYPISLFDYTLSDESPVDYLNGVKTELSSNDTWKSYGINIESVIKAAVQINTGGDDNNYNWYKHHYSSPGSYTITIECVADPNPPDSGEKDDQQQPIPINDSKYCGLFVKGPQSNEHHSYNQSNNISSALKAQYQGTIDNGPEKAIVTNESIDHVKAIYLPKTFKFSWYLFEYDNDSDFYHYAFPTKDDGYIVVDDNWDCAPLYGLDRNPYPSYGHPRQGSAQYYLFARCNIYGINLQMVYDYNNEVAVPRFRMGLANAFKNSKLKAIHSISSIWANEPYMFAETNLKSTGSIKNRFYKIGTGTLSNNEHWIVGETTTISDPAVSYGFNEEIGDHAFFNAANLKNIVICGDHQNFDVANATYRNKPLYQRGIASIGQYAFAFGNPTTIHRKVYIPTVIRDTTDYERISALGSSALAYSQIKIDGTAFENNDYLDIYINDTAPLTKSATDEFNGTEYQGVSINVPTVTLTSQLTATHVTLYVPYGKREKYLQDANWSRLGSNNIKAYDFDRNQIVEEE